MDEIQIDESKEKPLTPEQQALLDSVLATLNEIFTVHDVEGNWEVVQPLIDDFLDRKFVKHAFENEEFVEKYLGGLCFCSRISLEYKENKLGYIKKINDKLLSILENNPEWFTLRASNFIWMHIHDSCAALNTNENFITSTLVKSVSTLTKFIYFHLSKQSLLDETIITLFVKTISDCTHCLLSCVEHSSEDCVNERIQLNKFLIDRVYIATEGLNRYLTPEMVYIYFKSYFNLSVEYVETKKQKFNSLILIEEMCNKWEEVSKNNSKFISKSSFFIIFEGLWNAHVYDQEKRLSWIDKAISYWFYVSINFPFALSESIALKALHMANNGGLISGGKYKYLIDYRRILEKIIPFYCLNNLNFQKLSGFRILDVFQISKVNSLSLNLTNDRLWLFSLFMASTFSYRFKQYWHHRFTIVDMVEFFDVVDASTEDRTKISTMWKVFTKRRVLIVNMFDIPLFVQIWLSQVFQEPQPLIPEPNGILSPHQFEQYAAYYCSVVGVSRIRYSDALSQSIQSATKLMRLCASRAAAIAVYNETPKPLGSGWRYQYKLSGAIQNAKAHQQVLRQFRKAQRKVIHEQSNQFVIQFSNIITERLAELFSDIVNVDAQSSSESVTMFELSCHYVGEESLATSLAVDDENKATAFEDNDRIDDWLMCISAQLDEVDVLTGAGIPAGDDMSVEKRHQWIKFHQKVIEEVIDNDGVMSLQNDIQTATLQARLLNTVKARLQSKELSDIHNTAKEELTAGNMDAMFTMWQSNQLGAELTEQLDSLLGKLQPSPILSLRSDYRDEAVLEPASVEEVWQVMCQPESVRNGIQAHIKQWLEAHFEPLTWPELTTVDNAMSVRWLVLDVLLSTLLKQQVLHMPVDELKWLERRIPQWHMRWLRDKVYRPLEQNKISKQQAMSTLWHLFNYQTLPLDGLYTKPIDLHKNPTFEKACDVAKALLASTHCVTRDIEGGEVDQWPIMDIWMSAFTGRRDEYNLKCLDTYIRDEHKLPDNVQVQSYLPTFLQTGSTGLLDPIPTIDEVGNTLKPGQMMLLGVFTPQPDVSGPGVKYTEHTQHLHALCLSKPNDEVIAHYVKLTTPETYPNPDWHNELEAFWQARVGKEEKEEKEKVEKEEKSFASLLDSPPRIIQVVMTKLTELAQGLETPNGPGELFVLWPAQVPLQWQELTHQGSLNLLPWEYWLQQQNDCKVRWHRMVSIAHYMKCKTTPTNHDSLTQQDATSSEPSWHFSGEQQLNDLHDAHLSVWPYEAHIEDKHNNTLLDLVACLAKPADGVFIGHGQYNPQAPSQSHLLLDRGGQLPAWMLPALTINTRNLNLTVCETATNANHHMAISNLFLRAGVQSTIATLWPVPALSNLLFNLLLKQSAKGEPINRAHMWTAKKHLSQLTKDEAEALINTLPDSSNSIKEALSALNAHCTKELVTQAPIPEGKPLFNHPLYHAPYVWGE